MDVTISVVGSSGTSTAGISNGTADITNTVANTPRANGTIQLAQVDETRGGEKPGTANYTGVWKQEGVPIYRKIGEAEADSGPSASQLSPKFAAGQRFLDDPNTRRDVLKQIKLEEDTDNLSQVQKNKIKGDAFAAETVKKVQTTQTGVVQEVTVKTQSGVKTRLDILGRKSDNSPALTEVKSSQTAPLTKNQKVAFPEIKQSGAVVVGKGKPGFPAGTVIPPTEVEIVRPK